MKRGCLALTALLWLTGCGREIASYWAGWSRLLVAEERRRIARELHDSTGQNLIVANLMAGQLQNLSPPSCGPLITELKGTLEGAITEIRTVSYLLHPPLLDGGGLSIALRSYLDGFSKRTAIGVDLNLASNLGRMPADVELVLFRVIQEALTNIWRHSGSRTATIQLVRQVSNGRTQIILSIEDAGKGIPSNIRLSTLSRGISRMQAPSGLGLVGMRERLHQIRKPNKRQSLIRISSGKNSCVLRADALERGLVIRSQRSAGRISAKDIDVVHSE